MKQSKKILEIAQNIASIRNIAGISQKSFGSKIGISPEAVELLESGKVNVSIKTLQNLCEVYNKSSSDILGF